MINWNELSISKDNKCITIDVSIDNNELFNNITFKTIKLDNQNTFIDTETGPSQKAVTVYDVNNLDAYKCYDKIQDPSGRHVRLEIHSLGSLDPSAILHHIAGNMFFVWVEVNITGDCINFLEAPCCKDNRPLQVCSLVNLYPIYQKLLGSLKEMENTCVVPQNFINNYLQLQGIETALKTGNYGLAIKYWNLFNQNITTNTNSSHHCGCHGRF